MKLIRTNTFKITFGNTFKNYAKRNVLTDSNNNNNSIRRSIRLSNKYSKIIQNKISNKKSSKIARNNNNNVNTAVYCYCGTCARDDDDYTGCNKCPQWYHRKCLRWDIKKYNKQIKINPWECHICNYRRTNHWKQ